MEESSILIGTLVILNLSQLNVIYGAEDWDGIFCYTGKKATAKACNSCVTIYNNHTIIKRDCFESLNPTERLTCESSVDVKCDRCFEPFCNLGHPKHKCKTCDSKIDDKCLNNVPSLEMTQCLYDSNGLDDFYCFVRWNKTTGDNERGCITNTRKYSDCMHNKATCKLCIASDSDVCTIEFPQDRRKCIRCNSTTGNCPTQDAPESVNKYSVYCKNITDSCVVIDRESDNYFQICSSEMADGEKEYCTRYQEQCTFCTGENNCNLKKVRPSTTPTTNTPNVTTKEIQTTERPSSAPQIYRNNILFATFIIFSITLKQGLF